MFDELYPRTNGYVIFCHDGWGTQSNESDGYGLTNTLEYITFKGGPHTASAGMADISANFSKSNKWKSSKKRESNLKLDGALGNTVEFWLKKAAFDAAKTSKEVVLDIYTPNASAATNEYGRLTVEMSASDGGFLVTCMSGGAGVTATSVGSGLTIADDVWHHYAITVANTTGSSLELSLYVDGVHNETITSGSSINEVTGALVGYIGSLGTAPSGTSTPGLGLLRR